MTARIDVPGFTMTAQNVPTTFGEPKQGQAALNDDEMALALSGAEVLNLVAANQSQSVSATRNVDKRSIQSQEVNANLDTQVASAPRDTAKSTEVGGRS